MAEHFHCLGEMNAVTTILLPAEGHEFVSDREGERGVGEREGQRRELIYSSKHYCFHNDSQSSRAVFWSVQSPSTRHKLEHLLIGPARIRLVTHGHDLPQENSIRPEEGGVVNSPPASRQGNVCGQTHQMSDSMTNFPCRRASGAIHLTGSLRCPSTW